MQRIIVLDELSADGLNLLRSSAGIEFEVKPGLKGEALRTALVEFDGAICRSGVKITADSLEGNRRLKAIVRAGVGTDNIDKTAATKHGIIVMNTPAGNTVSTAEHTLALLLGLARNVAPAHNSLANGKWDRKSFEGIELRGKLLGIVGLGRIGLRVAELARAFEMNIVGYDPFLPRKRADELHIHLVDSLDSMLDKVDFLTVHVPMTPETNRLIGREQIARMKTGVRLINCARGGIYDEEALAEGLQSGRIGGVALDVYVEEPNTTSPLFKMPNTLCTPHLGASTFEAQRQVALEAVELLVGYLTTGEIRHAVNVSPVESKTLQKLRGYINVAYRLGVLMSQWHGGAINKCDLLFDGDIAGEDTRLLTSAFCCGLLSIISRRANVVNAELQCRERGIEITRNSRPAHGTFSNLITVKAIGEGQSIEASGTIFGRNMPRLVRLQNYPLEAYIDGRLLIFTHNDVPGIIAYVGTVLAEEKVNIAQMVVGRTSHVPGGSAIGVLNLDSDPSSQTLQRIMQHPQVEMARFISLPPPDEFPLVF